MTSLKTLQPPAHQDMAAHCAVVLREHAARHGWSKRLTNVVAASLRALLAWQDTPGAPVRASEAALLLSANRGMTTVESTLEVLAAAGLLEEDRVPSERRYFLAQIAGLPAAMTAELETPGTRSWPKAAPARPGAGRVTRRRSG